MFVLAENTPNQQLITPKEDGSWIKDVFLVKMKNAFVPVKRVYSVNIYSRISTVSQGSERSE